MSGRKKQPLSVIQGKGKSKHLTKEEIRKREKHEEKMKGFIDNIEPPSYLTAAQKREFMRLAEELIRLEIFNNLDVDSLARYLDSRDQYIRVVRLLRGIKTKDLKEGFGDFAQIQRSKNMLFNECRSAASDLGLTITSRLSLIIPKKEDDEKSEFDKRFGDV